MIDEKTSYHNGQTNIGPTEYKMTEDELACYDGRVVDLDKEKINSGLSILAPAEGKFTALGIHIALDLSNIKTNNKLAEAKKNYVDSSIKLSKLTRSQYSNSESEQIRNYFDKNRVNLYFTADNEIGTLKILYKPISNEDIRENYIKLLLQHKNKLLDYIKKCQSNYVNEIIKHQTSVLDDDSANSVFFNMIYCNNLVVILGRHIESMGFVGKIL